MNRRVVITGRGTISALGDDPAELHAALCRGESGLLPVKIFDTDELLPLALGGEAREFDAKSYLGKRNLRPLDRTCRLVTSAAQIALEDSGWNAESRETQELGLVLGTMYGSVRTIAEFDRRAVSAGPIYASPMDFANSVINAAAGQAAIWHGLRGVNSTLATGQTSGLRALEYAASLVASGRAEVVLAGGAEELCLESYLAFDRLGLCCRGPEPRPIPFDHDRNGMALGEGVGLLVIESAELAASRGAAVLAEIRGAGTAFDPSRGQDSESTVRSAAHAFRLALEQAGLPPGELGAISCSANGTATDDLEAQALAEVIAEAAERIPLTALKASLGETLGAAGALHAVATLETLRTRELPGIRDVRNLESGFPFPLAGPEPQSIEWPNVLLTAVGFDGQSAGLVISAPTAA